MNVPTTPLARSLNLDCQCLSLDHARLDAALESALPGLYAQIRVSRPHLFSDVMMFIDGQEARQMQALIAAIEQVAANPGYQAQALAASPDWAQMDACAHGVFGGYDFHLTQAGAQLIEINTNAGGALLNAYLARAQSVCCEAARKAWEKTSWPEYEQMFVDMFRAEWRLARGAAPLTAIAIVDETPQQQYLYPEFVLFERLFRHHGIVAVIAAPEELSLRQDALWCGAMRIDLVYNRLTDFALAQPTNAVLRTALTEQLAVVTPHPRTHALYADKRNLALLTDDAQLAAWGIDAATRSLLKAGIPHTERVVPARAEDFWARRRGLFFKPFAGFGSKAAYRGDKLTRRVFDGIASGGYVAQALAQPSLRRVMVDGERTDLKADLRCYVYDGQVQLMAARLWQGQTTNFRTSGGGFAAVMAVE